MQQSPPSAKTRAPASNIHSPAYQANVANPFKMNRKGGNIGGKKQKKKKGNIAKDVVYYVKIR